MFGFGRKKPTAQPEVIYRDRVVYVNVTSPDALALAERAESFLANAHAEYARLSNEGEHEWALYRQHKASGDLERAANAKHEIGSLQGQRQVILYAIARLTGQDDFTVSYAVPDAARERAATGEVFPFTSLLAGTSPLWPEDAHKKNRELGLLV
jgi:hypothetical protein